MLTVEDRVAAWELGSTAFGYRDRPMGEDWSPVKIGWISWGVFDADGRLLAKAVDLEQGQWFGGRVVPSCGLAGVAVAAESRNRGLGRIVLTRLFAEVRDRGAAIVSLFPTTPFPYRALGCEEVGALVHLSVQASALAAVRTPKSVTLRQATEADIPFVHDIYRTIASAGSGMMERSGPRFNDTPAELIADYHGITLAIGPEGAIEGYASWDRGSGYDETGSVTVYDLMGLTPDATAALVSMLGGWASVAPNVVLRLPPGDPALLQFSSIGATVHKRQPWMLRLVNAPAAVAARGWSPLLSGGVDLDLIDAVCPWNAGPHRLVLDGGDGVLEPGGSGAVRITERGLAQLYAGAADPATLRRAGMLTGGEPRDDDFLRTAFAGPVPALLDYF
ncbi:putative acetyltransferase [Allocatelliglobosispora scoriae]|uniref:Putative acetyltransferase n=1 Tax=Allocatelliglobosispora scoriae TaxID=643052 RepID=A0A841C1C0_9ACTN|nr:GNAT family N-acetyltransferase [Allocatelliglobosispora scoriae]MBB5873725.1 putative acetyltransferase [Allocatelliglobosispora scoriae]